MRRSYAGGAVSTTIVSPITTSSPNAVLTSANGWPDTSEGPFAAVLSRGTPTEEKVLIVDRSGTAITFSARGYDGTQAQNHSASATIEHIATAVDHDEANAHVNASTGVHGVVGSLVGTSGAQTLTDKTVSGPLADFVSLRRAGFEVATRTGTETLTNKTLTSPVLTGTAQAGQVNADSVNIGGVPVVTTTASQVVENKTIKNSAIENSSLVGATVDGVITAGAGSTFEGSEIVNVDKNQTLDNKELESPVVVNLTLDGFPMRNDPFYPPDDPRFFSVTTPTGYTSGTTPLQIFGQPLQLTLLRAAMVEVTLSFSRIDPNPSGVTLSPLLVQIRLDGDVVMEYMYPGPENVQLSRTGGTFRALLSLADESYEITATLQHVAQSGHTGGTRVYAAETAPRQISVRALNPTGL